jgi:hypothetical protein
MQRMKMIRKRAVKIMILILNGIMQIFLIIKNLISGFLALKIKKISFYGEKISITMTNTMWHFLTKSVMSTERYLAVKEQ